MKKKKIYQNKKMVKKHNKNMKKLKILMFFGFFGLIFCLNGCGLNEIESAKITRDDVRTGGSLSFVYDKKDRVVYIGGESDVIQYSSEDETKNLQAGNRVGLKVTAPDEAIDVENATLEMNGVNYASGDFLELINGQKQRFFVIQPTFSKEVDEMKFSITWDDKTKKQEYKIEIIDGTKFMDAEGNV